MKKLYNQVIESKVAELKLEIKRTKSFSKHTPKWSKLIPITDKHYDGISKAIGVYKIIHAPTGKIMAIGQGNVANRRARHLQIFRNKGQSILNKLSGSSCGSQTGSKMYKFDKNINNWLFSWCNCHTKNIAIELETRLINKHKPEFNLETMAGVS